MLKYSLLPSTQAGPFSNQNKMIDLEVMDNMILNPSQSFVQLSTSLSMNVPAGTQPTDVYNMVFVNAENYVPVLNSDLIRNCYLSGAKVGKMENIRRVNVLRHNLVELSKSSTRLKSQVNSLYQMGDYVNHQKLSPFVEMHKEGVIPSRYIDARLRIPLSDLFELGSLASLDLSKTGKLTIHLELEDLSYFNISWQKMFVGMTDEGVLNNDTVGSQVKFTTTATYPSLDYSPFYVGQPLLLDYTAYNNNTAGAATVDVNTTVTGIEYSSKTKVITLSLSVGTPAFPQNVNSFRAIKVRENLPGNAPTATYSIDTAQIGVCEIMGKVASPDDIGYMTWTTEEYTSGGQTFLNKIFEIEPTAVNALLMFDSNSSNLISNNTDLTTYRMRCNNLDIYDRDIYVNLSNNSEKYIHDTLHYDSINRTFKNMGKPLKNLALVNMDVSEIILADRFTTDENQIMFLACPVPETAASKQLQINAISGAAINNVILYKQVMKLLKF